MIKCKKCEGDGRITIADYDEHSERLYTEECIHCEGTGNLIPLNIVWMHTTRQEVKINDY